MRLPAEPSSQEKKRGRFRIGLIGVGALVLLLIGGTISLLAHHTPNASASTVVGVYVGAGDGTLFKLNGEQGTAIWHIQATDRGLPASPTVANGVVYFGTLDGNVYAVSTSAGQQLWHYQTSGSVLSSPTVANNVVYVSSTDNYVYALNAQNGSLLWRFDTGSGNEAVTPGSVVVVNGIVYGSSSDQADHSYLFALNASTGTQLWRIKVQSQLLGNVQVANSVIYVTSSPLARVGSRPQATSSSVSAYNVKTGAQLWSTGNLGTLGTAAPVISNSTVYVGSQNNSVYALNAQTGAQTWHHTLGGPIYAAPVVANGVLFVGVAATASTSVQAHSRTSDASSAGSTIVALNVTTGSQLWQQTSLSTYTGTPLAQYGTLLYFGTKDNQVYALDLTTGAIVWHYQMASANPLNNAPITAAS